MIGAHLKIKDVVFALRRDAGDGIEHVQINTPSRFLNYRPPGMQVQKLVGDGESSQGPRMRNAAGHQTIWW